VATELIRKSPLERVQERMPLVLSARVLLGGLAFVVALALFGLLAGLYDARRAEDAAHTRFVDAQTLASLPPASTDSIEEDLAAVNNQLGTAQIEATPAAESASADATATILVRGAQAAGLSVKALSGVASGQTKVGSNTYDTQGIRMTVDGSAGQITGFLDALSSAQPSLIPSLTTMTLGESGVAHAEIVFSTFTKAAMPTPLPVATPKGKKS
jgi:hypothetical protein